METKDVRPTVTDEVKEQAYATFREPKKRWGKRAPCPTKEYVLVYDLSDFGGVGAKWPYPILVKQDTVVINVRFANTPNFMGDMLLFNVKETGEEFHTHYGYMFADNTPENLEKLRIYRHKRDEYFAARQASAKALKDVLTVKGPFEGNNGEVS
jgi:hypothetical protein